MRKTTERRHRQRPTAATLAALAAAIAIVSALPAALAAPVTLTDVAGRQVTVDLPVKKLILGEGRFLPSLAILERDDPVSYVAAMMTDLRRFDPNTYAQYLKAFPTLADVPDVGVSGSASFSTEQAIGSKPDVAVFGLGAHHGPGERNKEILAQLEAAGIPVVVIDFRLDPLVNTPKSMDLLGRLLGREDRAQAFNAFYQQNLDIVAERLKSTETRPGVFMELRVGLRDQCCETTGNQMLGRFIEWAGGRNIVADKIPGTHGVVNSEFLLAAQPDIYVATAVGNYPIKDSDTKRVALGAGTPPDAAAMTLRNALARPIVAELNAVRDGKAYAIWHHFYNTPMNVTAVQAMAKWFHPDLFADLDPRKTLEEYYARFQPLALDGTYWTGMTPE